MELGGAKRRKGMDSLALTLGAHHSSYSICTYIVMMLCMMHDEVAVVVVVVVVIVFVVVVDGSIGEGCDNQVCDADAYDGM